MTKQILEDDLNIMGLLRWRLSAENESNGHRYVWMLLYRISNVMPKEKKVDLLFFDEYI